MHVVRNIGGLRMAILKVRQKGQITLPKEMRDTLDIQENKNLLAWVEGNVITLIPLPRTTDGIDDLIGLLPHKPNINIDQARNIAKQERAQKRLKNWELISVLDKIAVTEET